jgi:hypothetical protein
VRELDFRKRRLGEVRRKDQPAERVGIGPIATTNGVPKAPKPLQVSDLGPKRAPRGFFNRLKPSTRLSELPCHRVAPYYVASHNGYGGKGKALLGESSRRDVAVSDAMSTEFSSEELLSQAQGNATALALGAIAYLKDQNSPADEFFKFVGERFAPGWEELRGGSTKDVARTAALNMVSVGGSLRSLSGDDNHAEVLIAGWPANEFLTSS